MTQTEDYVPSRDKDSFQKKTSGQLLKLLARIRMQTVRRKEKEISAGISLLLLFVTVFLTVCAHGLRFPVTVLGLMIVLLAAFSGKDIRQILAETLTGSGIFPGIYTSGGVAWKCVFHAGDHHKDRSHGNGSRHVKPCGALE